MVRCYYMTLHFGITGFLLHRVTLLCHVFFCCRGWLCQNTVCCEYVVRCQGKIQSCLSANTSSDFEPVELAFFHLGFDFTCQPGAKKNITTLI